MSMEARAAQFAPFAALTGYEHAIKEAQMEKEEMQRQLEEADDDF